MFENGQPIQLDAAVVDEPFHQLRLYARSRLLDRLEDRFLAFAAREIRHEKLRCAHRV